MLPEEFVLPEKWCIKNNSEIDQILSDYALKTIGRVPIDKYKDSYWHFPQISFLVCTIYKPISGYTEITFEQFKKYVMKETEKKIIEYRCKDEFLKASEALYEIFEKDNKGGYGRLDFDCVLKKQYEKAGVLNIWFDPVYEEQVETLELVVHGSNKNLYLKVNSKGELWEYLGRSKDFDSKKYIKNSLPKFIEISKQVLTLHHSKIHGYTVILNKVNLGCWENIEWNELNTAALKLRDFLVKHNLWKNS